MNAAAQALLETQLPFAVLPLGTANDLARVFGIPADPAAAAQIVVQGRRNRIDLGRANDRLFFNIATIGLSARLRAPWTSRPRSGSAPWPIRRPRFASGSATRFTRRSRPSRAGWSSTPSRSRSAMGAITAVASCARGGAPSMIGCFTSMRRTTERRRTLGQAALAPARPALVTTGVETLTATAIDVATSEPLPVNTDARSPRKRRFGSSHS